LPIRTGKGFWKDPRPSTTLCNLSIKPRLHGLTNRFNKGNQLVAWFSDCYTRLGMGPSRTLSQYGSASHGKQLASGNLKRFTKRVTKSLHGLTKWNKKGNKGLIAWPGGSRVLPATFSLTTSKDARNHYFCWKN